MIQKRRRHAKEFKEQLVKLVIDKGYSVSEAARNLDIHPNLLSRWKQQIVQEKNQPFSNNGNSSDLKKENERLRMEKEILKKAAAFFAKESSEDLNS